METTTKAPIFPIALRYGLYAGLVMIILSAVLNITELSFNKVVGYLSLPIYLGISIAAIVFAYKDFKAQNNGYLSFGQAIGLGTLLSIVAGFLSGLFMTIYVKLIDPTFTDKTIDNARKQMEEQGKLTDEQIDSAIDMTRSFTEVMMSLSFIINPIIYAIGGLILSLIIGAIMKKERDLFAQ